MPDNQELHIGTVSKPRFSPETVYDVECTNTLPSNPITIYKPRAMDGDTGEPYSYGPEGLFFVAVDGYQFSEQRFAFNSTNVKLVEGTLWESSRKVGAQRYIQYQENIHLPTINLVDLNNVLPSNYANWDIIIGPDFAMQPSNWRSFLVYSYVNITAVPDDETRLALTCEDIGFDDFEENNPCAWFYVVETKTLWVAVRDVLRPPTDPLAFSWAVHTNNIVIDFPQGVNRKRQCIARYQAVPASNKGNKVYLDYKAEIKDPDTGTTMTLEGSSVAYTVFNSPFGANLVFRDPRPFNMFPTNGDMHGTVTMTETPVT